MKVYESDYLIQRGSGCRERGRCHSGDYFAQRGGGIGSIFSNIFRRLIPLGAKLFNFGRKAASSTVGRQVVKAAKRTALDAGLNLTGDVLEGKNLKQAVKSRLKEAGTKLPSNVERELRGGRRAKKKKKVAKKKVQRKSKTKQKLKVKKKQKKKKKKSANKKQTKRVSSTQRAAAARKKMQQKKRKTASGKRGGTRNLLSGYL